MEVVQGSPERYAILGYFLVLQLDLCQLYDEAPSLSRAGDQAVRALQGIPRPPTDVAPLEPQEIAQAFRDFMVYAILWADRGHVALDQSKSRSGYATWFYSVSHLVMSPPAEVYEEPPTRPPNEKVILDEKYARQGFRPTQGYTVDITKEALCYQYPHLYY